ncbi:MAG: hypothetical protein AAGA77_10220 [Bacteroidota bacterium]
MHKHLYFICPTDHLETIVNETFQGDNYFVTTLGNSITFDLSVSDEISNLIESKGIKEVTFLLADDNQIVTDALQNQRFSEIKGLNNLYIEVAKKTSYSKMLWLTSSHSISMLSYYLNIKANELRPRLYPWLLDTLKIHTQIYRRANQTFSKIAGDLLHMNLPSLN